MTLALITFIVFLTLKLTGTVDWSWVIIFLPFIVQMTFWVGVAAEKRAVEKAKKK